MKDPFSVRWDTAFKQTWRSELIRLSIWLNFTELSCDEEILVCLDVKARFVFPSLYRISLIMVSVNQKLGCIAAYHERVGNNEILIARGFGTYLYLYCPQLALLAKRLKHPLLHIDCAVIGKCLLAATQPFTAGNSIFEVTGKARKQGLHHSGHFPSANFRKHLEWAPGT